MINIRVAKAIVLDSNKIVCGSMFIHSYCLVLSSWKSQRAVTAGGKSFHGKFDIVSTLIIHSLSLSWCSEES